MQDINILKRRMGKKMMMNCGNENKTNDEVRTNTGSDRFRSILNSCIAFVCTFSIVIIILTIIPYIQDCKIHRDMLTEYEENYDFDVVTTCAVVSLCDSYATSVYIGVADPSVSENDLLDLTDRTQIKANTDVCPLDEELTEYYLKHSKLDDNVLFFVNGEWCYTFETTIPSTELQSMLNIENNQDLMNGLDEEYETLYEVPCDTTVRFYISVEEKKLKCVDVVFLNNENIISQSLTIALVY